MSNRSPAVINQAKKTQPYCTRCASQKDLNGHHIEALADGGADDIENIEVLCHRCHREWHNMEGIIEFEDFLEHFSI